MSSNSGIFKVPFAEVNGFCYCTTDSRSTYFNFTTSRSLASLGTHLFNSDLGSANKLLSYSIHPVPSYAIIIARSKLFMYN